MSKKAETGNQLMFFVFLLMLLLVGIGIVAGTAIFFGGEYDVRGDDAYLLSYKVRECILENGIGNINSKNFYSVCGINESALELNDFILKICVNSTNCLIEEDPLLTKGVNIISCGFEGTKSNSAFPRCVERNFTMEGKNVDIITGSNQKSKRGAT